jgi:hypothetical protein
MKQKTLYFLSAVTILGLYLVSTVINDTSINSVFALGAVLGGLGLVYTIYNRNKIENIIEKNTSNGSTRTNYSINDCKEIAMDWARKEFDNNHGKALGFSWNVATSDKAPVFDFQQREFYTARLFYTNYGDKNTRIYLFIDATNGEVISPKPGQMVNENDPFMALEEYRLTRKHLPRIMAMQNRSGNDSGVPFDDIEFSVTGNNNNNAGQVE